MDSLPNVPPYVVPPYVRATGISKCAICQKLYNEHKHYMIPGTLGLVLTKLCDGRYVKL